MLGHNIKYSSSHNYDQGFYISIETLMTVSMNLGNYPNGPPYIMQCTLQNFVSWTFFLVMIKVAYMQSQRQSKSFTLVSLGRSSHFTISLLI